MLFLGKLCERSFKRNGRRGSSGKEKGIRDGRNLMVSSRMNLSLPLRGKAMRVRPAGEVKSCPTTDLSQSGRHTVGEQTHPPPRARKTSTMKSDAFQMFNIILTNS